jgi:glutathione synthase/RimK-type ligase-like ATP-grasp enzyme
MWRVAALRHLIMIIIVANELDAHADAVIISLRKLGFTDLARIDFETAHHRYELQALPTARQFSIADRGERGNLITEESTKTIWWRRDAAQLSLKHLQVPEENSLDEIECYWGYRWLLESQPPELFPLSHPARMREASNKLLQLWIARETGLTSPATLFTNSKQALSDFASKYQQVVLKPLKVALVRDSATDETISIVSRGVSAQRLHELSSAEQEVAAFCQEKVQKIADVRVNVLPSRSIACRIETSALAGDDVDWRATTFDHGHEIISFPKHLDEACRKFLRLTDLKWGAFDFGLTESGEWIFFECNPNGQWLWIELKTGLPLSEFFARELIDHHYGR